MSAQQTAHNTYVSTDAAMTSSPLTVTVRAPAVALTLSLAPGIIHGACGGRAHPRHRRSGARMPATTF